MDAKFCDALAGCFLSPPSAAAVWGFGRGVVSRDTEGFKARSGFAEMLVIGTVAGGKR